MLVVVVGVCDATNRAVVAGRVAFALQTGEFITAISGKAGNYIGSLQFHTNRRSSPVFGTSQGQWAGSDFRIEAPSGTDIVGFHGRSSKFLHAIGVIIRAEE